jgi:glycosyltransferase involved in cell wall biosynthesis
MKIALLITDDREPQRKYSDKVPFFGTAPTALLQGFAKRPDLEVHIVSCTQRPMSSPDKLADNIFFHSLHVPKIGWLKTLYQGCIRAARRKLQEIKPDIVHGQGSERDQNISAIFSGFPNVLTIHGNMRLVAKLSGAKPLTYQWLAARLEQFTVPRADGVVCISRYTQDAVKSLAKKTWLLPNAVDGSFFEVERKESALPQILCVANVDARKNQNALIRAIDRLGPKRNFELVFLGGANRDTVYVQEFFDLLKSRPWCRYDGYTSREGLKGYMATAAGVILPSLEDNCPMVVLEGMAAGVPVAAARVGGVPDLVRDGETGWLFDPLSAEAMAEAMARLIQLNDGVIAKRARAEAVERFHHDFVAARHVEIYREVISSHSRS